MNLIDCSRVPFDLLEAESELVSGYCTEFGSVIFIVSFLTEYLDIIIVNLLTIDFIPIKIWLFDFHLFEEIKMIQMLILN